MSKIKIVANVEDGDYSGAVRSNGTDVFIGDQRVDQIVRLALEPVIGGVWQLTIVVNVNPVDLIVPKK